MRVCVSVLAIGAVLTSAAQAQPFNVSCVRGADERTIEIVSPGEVGATCDVQYAQGGTTRTPYHANNTASFCQEKATEIVTSLITDGFACGQVGGPLTAEARAEPETLDLAEPAPTPITEPEPAIAPNEIAAPAPTTQEPALEETTAAVVDAPAPVISEPVAAVEAAPEPEAEPAPEPVVADVAATVESLPPVEPEALVGAAPIEEPFASAAAPERFEAEALAPISVEETPAETLPPASDADPVALNDEDELLTEPGVDTVATRGPATLAGDDLEILPKVAEPIPTGRLVGAAPTLAPPPASTGHALQSPTGGAAEPATSVTTVSTTAPTRPEATRSSPLRDPQEIIVATLHAQAAAWNEGNLQAFMETYWKDDDLKFVSGTAVTKGWAATMKRYRERYSDGSGLGQLSFERTDVEMISDDVAIVTGRFNHVKNEEASSGAFTLVMKRMGGVWRIVHDHTASDQPNG